MTDHNPKVAAGPASNLEKDADEWVSGDEPMTGAQASYLKTLSEEAHHPDVFDQELSKAEASKRIDALKEEVERMKHWLKIKNPNSPSILRVQDGTW